jgi:hypothetical protein
MDRHGVRYMFEHRVLPSWFYEDKEKFVGLLLDDHEILFRIIDGIFKQEDVENPYTCDQFDIDAAKITDEVFMIKVIYPEPEEEPLCYCSYLFFDREFNKMGYYCIEKGSELSNYYPYVCSWNKEGAHTNYGNCTFEKNADFIRCIDIFMGK